VHRQRGVVDRGSSGGDRHAVVEDVKADAVFGHCGEELSALPHRGRPAGRHDRGVEAASRGACDCSREEVAPFLRRGVREKAVEPETVVARDGRREVHRGVGSRHACAAEPRVAVD
jgi:hypothetical protein